ncbi:XisH family protein [Nostoc sp. WHI]|uniref:XisH family protein n=1 Tax=Nostoc sp. WHI TaxID=2650611 RepID=UPI0018C5DA0E|nr:XisH family protein [Nostoc sp. WHI]MBG1269965.1 fatty-acid oxidation protein subunit alpha [Nostoc sp. WHI]
MSARDTFHQLVRTALENEGWVITHDPYHIDLGFVDFYIDLGAEQLLAATKGDQKIAVEIKTFLAASTISEFHTAIGQFINYRIALEDDDLERRLYLAVPLDVYKRFLALHKYGMIFLTQRRRDAERIKSFRFKYITFHPLIQQRPIFQVSIYSNGHWA